MQSSSDLHFVAEDVVVVVDPDAEHHHFRKLDLELVALRRPHDSLLFWLMFALCSSTTNDGGT